MKDNDVILSLAVLSKLIKSLRDSFSNSLFEQKKQNSEFDKGIKNIESSNTEIVSRINDIELKTSELEYADEFLDKKIDAKFSEFETNVDDTLTKHSKKMKDLLKGGYHGGGSGGGGAATWGTITGTLSNQTDLQSALNAKLTKNAPITGGTSTKITYDANGLVTGGANATTADIAPSTNRNYVTDAQQTVIGNTSGINTGDQTITLSGDVTGTGTGPITATLATVNSGVGTFGSSTQVPQVTFDGKGRATAASNVSIQITESQVTNLTSDLAAKESTFNKDASNGYAGLTLFKINMKNVLGTFTSFFTNSNTAARTYTLPDKDGTVAMTSDIPGVFTSVANGLAPLSGGGTTNFLRADGTWAVPAGGGGGLTVTQAQIDFGTKPRTGDTFTITDASVSPTSKIIVTPSGTIPSGRGTIGDDYEWDGITFAARSGTGSFTLIAKATGKVVGKRNIYYTVN